MAQTLPGDLIDVQGDKNTTVDKERRKHQRTFGQLFPGPRITTKKRHRLSLQVHGITFAKQ